MHKWIWTKTWGNTVSHDYLFFTHFQEAENQSDISIGAAIFFQRALLSSHLLKPAAITLGGTCHLYWKDPQPGWMILVGRYPAYLRCRERCVHCHSCLLTPMFENKKRVQAQLSLTIQIRGFIYIYFSKVRICE